MKNFKEIKTLKDEYVKAGLCQCVEPFETVEDAESFLLTPLNQEETGLPMCVHLRCIENKEEPPFLRFQNDRNSRYNTNWVKMYIDGTLDNRMRHGYAHGNVHAKTGTVTGVSSLAGYCTAANGHVLCFSIINMGIRHTSSGRRFQDKVCEALCRP